MRGIVLIELGFCVLLGCPATEGRSNGEPPPQGPTSPPPTDAEEALEDCANVWGPPPASGRVHVWVGQPDGGDGSLLAPFNTVAAALVETRASGARSLAIGPGAYDGSLTLSSVFDDDDLTVQGCGVAATTLQAVEDPLTGAALPTIDISGESTVNVSITDLTLSGGRPNLLVQAGAGSGAGGPIVAEDLRLIESERFGAVIADLATSVRLTRFDVEGVAARKGEYGWGISVQNGAAYGGSIAGLVVLEDVTITDAVEVGFFAEGANLEVTGLKVDDTQARLLDGLFGRGVQLQDHTTAHLTDLMVTNAFDAGVFIHKPGRAGAPIEFTGGDILNTSLTTLPDGTTTGDNLVITRGDSGLAPEELLVVADDLGLSGADRATGIIDGALLRIDHGIQVDGTLHGFVTQVGGTIQDLVGGPPPVAFEDRLTGDELELDLPVLLSEHP